MADVSLPSELQGYAGRITDIDSHEMIPGQLWGVLRSGIRWVLAELVCF
jgi:hypothetical protein